LVLIIKLKAYYFCRTTNPFHDRFILFVRISKENRNGKNSTGCRELKITNLGDWQRPTFFCWPSCPLLGAKTHYAFTLLNTCVHFMQPIPAPRFDPITTARLPHSVFGLCTFVQIFIANSN